MTKTGAAQIARMAIDETPLQKFEREVQDRNPGRTIVRFDFPKKIREARAIYLREVTSRDELDAAKYADATMDEIEKKSVKLSTEAERKECVRFSIVGLVSRNEPTTYRHVASDPPFHEIDSWSSKATTCLSVFFNNLNGIDADELKEGIKGARTIGASVPPTGETPPSADTES